MSRWDVSCWALHLHTFIAAERGDFQEALRRSDKEMNYRPCVADAYTERGAILNNLHRPEEAMKAYRRARQLAERFASNAAYRAPALRGIGFTQDELGNLQAARAAIEVSFELAPENELGLKELRHIKHLQRRAGSGDETE